MDFCAELTSWFVRVLNLLDFDFGHINRREGTNGVGQIGIVQVGKVVRNL